MAIIGYPLGWIMWLMYTIIPNYAVAMILFTIVTKLMLIPLSIKQQKGSVKMQIMQPKIQELQTKYKSNPQKMQEEMQALYKRENYNMAAGCLPMLIQFPILFGLIDVVYKPLTHLVRVPKEVLEQVATIFANSTEAIQAAGITLNTAAPQISQLNAVQQMPQLFASIGQEMIDKISSLDMMCFGIDMSANPGFGLNLLVLIPIISGATAFLMSFISMRNNPSGTEMGGSMKVMMYMMPLMSVYFTTIVPAGVGLYWIFSNVVGCVQTVVLNKFWNPREMADKLRAEDEARREQERQEKIELKKLAKERGDEVIEEKALSQKEKDRIRLNEARKRNAELYGDYSDDSDVTDNDLKG